MLESAALLEIRKSTIVPSERTNSPTSSISKDRRIPSTLRDLTEVTEEAAVVVVVAAEAEAAELVVRSPVRVADSSN